MICLFFIVSFFFFPFFFADVDEKHIMPTFDVYSIIPRDKHLIGFTNYIWSMHVYVHFYTYIYIVK